MPAGPNAPVRPVARAAGAAVGACVALALLVPAVSAPSGAAGTLHVRGSVQVVADGPDGDAAVLTRADGSTLTLAGPAASSVRTGQVVDVVGRQQGATLVGEVTATSTPTASLAVSPMAAPTALVHQVVLVRATWTGGPNLVNTRNGNQPPPSLTELRQHVAAASTYWSGQTHGLVTFAVSGTFDDVVVDATNPCTSVDDYVAFMAAVQTRIGFTVTMGRHMVVFFPATPCGWSGRGQLGSSLHQGGTLAVDGSDVSGGVLAHELGHNLSLHHAQETHCFSGSAQMVTSSTCFDEEYGDDCSVMGDAWDLGAIDADQRVRLGIETTTVLDQAGQQVTLRPMGTGSTDHAATFTVGSTTYTLQYRYPVGQDAHSVGGMCATGVSVLKTEPAVDVRYSRMLDGDPAHNPWADDVTKPQAFEDGADALPVGSWIDVDGAGLEVTATSATGATVVFTPSLGVPVVPVAPVGAALAPAQGWLTDGGVIGVHVAGPITSGLTYRLRLGQDVRQVAPASAVRLTGTGWSTAQAWQPMACSSAGCARGPETTLVTSPYPVHGHVDYGRLGDGAATLSVTGWSASRMTGWRLVWCDTRVSPQCNPYSAPGHGSTTVRRGNAVVRLSMPRHSAVVGRTSIVAARGTGAYRARDVYRLGIITYRGPLATYGFSLDGHPVDTLTWWP